MGSDLRLSCVLLLPNTRRFATKCSTFAPRRTLSRTEGEGDIAPTLSGRFPFVPDYYGYDLRDAGSSLTLSGPIARDALDRISGRERAARCR